MVRLRATQRAESSARSLVRGRRDAAPLTLTAALSDRAGPRVTPLSVTSARLAYSPAARLGRVRNEGAGALRESNAYPCELRVPSRTADLRTASEAQPATLTFSNARHSLPRTDVRSN